MPARTDTETMHAYLRNAAEWDMRAVNARSESEREGARKVADSYRALARAVGWDGKAEPPAARRN
ncbi:MAG TPA: hypothetical protein VGL66_00125 [Caulobacteraceae bacterium]|jgi:hypothetical protein